MATTAPLPPKIAEAADFLREQLQDGPRPAGEVKAAAQAAGVNHHALAKASRALRVWKSREHAPVWALARPLSGQAKVCRRCGRTKALEDFSMHPKEADGRESRCKLCRNAGKRRSERALADPGGFAAADQLVERAPDPWPAVRLREELARLRDQGEAFPVAWERALQVVGADADWRRAFEKTQGAWREAYVGVGQPLALAAAA